jgi:hypothetical protein
MALSRAVLAQRRSRLADAVALLEEAAQLWAQHDAASPDGAPATAAPSAGLLGPVFRPGGGEDGPEGGEGPSARPARAAKVLSAAQQAARAADDAQRADRAEGARLLKEWKADWAKQREEAARAAKAVAGPEVGPEARAARAKPKADGDKAMAAEATAEAHATATANAYTKQGVGAILPFMGRLSRKLTALLVAIAALVCALALKSKWASVDIADLALPSQLSPRTAPETEL